MIKLLAEIFNILFSCKDYTKRFSHSLDRPLSGVEGIKLRVHHIICQRCRVVSKQVQELEGLTAELFNEPDSTKLSKDFSQRLKNKLKDGSNSD